MSQHILITGANRGIGLSLTRFYQAKGDKVYALCRQTSDALEKTGATVLSGYDVAKDEDVNRLAQILSDKNIRLDMLINNAGIFRNETLDDMNFATIEEQFQVNALAPLKVTTALLPLLNNKSKLAMITSRMGSIADNGSGAYYGYRASKAALNAFGMSLARDLKDRGTAVALLHPGYVQTDMVGGNGDISADEAATRLMARIDELNLDNSGGFWHSNGERLPW